MKVDRRWDQKGDQKGLALALRTLYTTYCRLKYISRLRHVSVSQVGHTATTPHPLASDLTMADQSRTTGEDCGALTAYKPTLT